MALEPRRMALIRAVIFVASCLLLLERLCCAQKAVTEAPIGSKFSLLSNSTMIRINVTSGTFLSMSFDTTELTLAIFVRVNAPPNPTEGIYDWSKTIGPNKNGAKATIKTTGAYGQYFVAVNVLNNLRYVSIESMFFYGGVCDSKDHQCVCDMPNCAQIIDADFKTQFYGVLTDAAFIYYRLNLTEDASILGVTFGELDKTLRCLIQYGTPPLSASTSIQASALSVTTGAFSTREIEVKGAPQGIYYVGVYGSYTSFSLKFGEWGYRPTGCPSDCSDNMEHCYYGRCDCKEGWIGDDCSKYEETKIADHSNRLKGHLRAGIKNVFTYVIEDSNSFFGFLLQVQEASSLVIAQVPVRIDVLFLDHLTPLANFSYILSEGVNNTIDVPWNCSCTTTHAVLTITGFVPGTNYVINTYPFGERGMPAWGIALIVLSSIAIIVAALMYTYRRQMSGYAQQKDETTADETASGAEDIELSEISEQASSS